jgi:hypothetical protein
MVFSAKVVSSVCTCFYFVKTLLTPLHFNMVLKLQDVDVTQSFRVVGKLLTAAR